MPDYYIRTPNNESSRGPFDIPKLLTLAEANQVNENTLYYDEAKEEWMPIGLNEELKGQVFPKRERLSLKPKRQDKDSDMQVDDEADESASGDHDIEKILAAAEGQTEETRHLKQRAKSFNKAASLATTGVGLIFLLTAFSLIFPHFEVIKLIYDEETYLQVLNYPFLIVGVFDLLMALFLFLAITEIFPVLRFRGMLTFGFGLYLGWAIDDPFILTATAAAGTGIFLATIAQRLSLMIIALVLGILGNGALAYLAFSGRFEGFLDIARLNLIPAT